MSFRADRLAAGHAGSRPGDALAKLGVAEREVTGGEVAADLRLEQRLLDAADLRALPAARVEATSRWRRGRARHVATEDLALLPRARPRDRNRRQQSARVRVARVRVERLAVGHL